ncbi:MAG TPA: 3-oxoacyl-ACP synthase [Cryomorphaceae bacterium]|nr:3-oxoacyl-ACP synthase [Owenweeksia sp.]MBF97821.1 3-oxoacyl-ACP synthase [Owenweeksia sp.]HAD96636.1 3-oxoacyl-ACP synthase [Cryomorphaceae bacterium]HBF21510.1 3-oxoacyl-ACP synthase [Cryomorphaceae bacterium]HCQ15512.1 3-oxoacyl-ACP synthase [Cryomorphaceae bacterium]|tara:strand:+ start:3821 stop:4891 length:1071 start_codon:yes stop_codon:yes gene_type:complete
MKRTVITGTGSYIPELVQRNSDFLNHRFFTENQEPIGSPPTEITEKFQNITGIKERRYVTQDLHTSDIGVIAARRAIEDSGIDPETIDQIIFAHNFGDVRKHTIQTDILPALASRVKHQLGIKNPFCIPYDILFGCPGWVQGVIQADAYFKAGIAKRALVIGAETLSRVLDGYDRDSMIFSDGAGAAVVEYQDCDNECGILSSATMSHTTEEVDYLYLGKSNFPESDPRIRYIKMKGRKVYEYALSQVPQAMKMCLEKADIDIHDVSTIFIHQANEKLDEGVIKRLYRLYKINEIPEGIMPMSVHELGNSSVATIPTLFDRVRRHKLEGHSVHKGDILLFASVGSGMNINAFCYRV